MRIAIIGGGIYGAAVAFFLVDNGAEDVVLFERNHVASGSTGYSAGIIRHHYSSEHHIKFAKRGHELIRSLPPSANSDGGYHNNGYVRLATESDRDDFERIVTAQQSLGVDVDMVDQADLRSIMPSMNVTSDVVASFDRDAGFADPYLVTAAYSTAAQENGVEVLSNSEVTGITRKADRVTGVTTVSDEYPVDFVVNTAGAWGGDIASMVGIDLPISWHESKLVVLSSPEKYDPSQPSVSDHLAKPDMYTKPEPGGDFLVGGIDRPPVDRSVGLEGVTESHLEQVSTRIANRFPVYADASVVDTWSGIISMTPDAHQIVGIPRELQNFYNLVGGNGHGFKEAPGFAESAALDILDQEPRIDLGPYRLSRFAEHDTFSDSDEKRYGYEDGP